MEKKNNIGLVALLVLIIVLLVGYIIYMNVSDNSAKVENNSSVVEDEKNDSNSDQSDSNNGQSNSNNDKNNGGSETEKNSTILFDGSKSINNNGSNYTLACQGSASIWVTVDSTQKVLNFSFTPSKVVEHYSLNWTSDKISVASSKINFDKKIVEVFFGAMGQDSSGDTLFILLEDGSLEYIPVVHMFNHVQAEVVSYGKVNGVSDVAKLALSSTSNGVTTLAIKNDGSFYDLWYSLKDTGNY